MEGLGADQGRWNRDGGLLGEDSSSSGDWLGCKEAFAPACNFSDGPHGVGVLGVHDGIGERGFLFSCGKGRVKS